MTFEEWFNNRFEPNQSGIGILGAMRDAWEAGKAEGAREEREACAKLCEAPRRNPRPAD